MYLRTSQYLSRSVRPLCTALLTAFSILALSSVAGAQTSATFYAPKYDVGYRITLGTVDGGPHTDLYYVVYQEGLSGDGACDVQLIGTEDNHPDKVIVHGSSKRDEIFVRTTGGTQTVCDGIVLYGLPAWAFEVEVHGGLGSDIILGVHSRPSEITVYGGSGADYIFSFGDIYGGSGNDFIYGPYSWTTGWSPRQLKAGSGNDIVCLDPQNISASVTVTQGILLGGTGTDYLYGTKVAPDGEFEAIYPLHSACNSYLAAMIGNFGD